MRIKGIARSKKLDKKKRRMPVDGAQMKKLMLDLIYRRKS